MRATVLILLVALSVATGPAAAQSKSTSSGVMHQKSGGGSTTYSTSSGCADKLQVTGFTVTPSNPLPGQTVTAKMTVKHLCTSGSVNVPWKLFVGSTQIGSGTKSNVAAGLSFEVSANWTAASGQHQFDGAADPDKTLGESSSNHGNNYPSGVVLNVPKMVTQVLKWSDAAKAGAQFPAPPAAAVSGITHCPPWGQFEPLPGNFPDFLQFSIVFSINCGIAIPPLSTTVVELEAFKSFRLKNGWKVKEVSESGASSDNLAGHAWVQKPAVGSDDPYMKSKLNYQVVYTPGLPPVWVRRSLVRGVKVTIEGPEGTSPY